MLSKSQLFSGALAPALLLSLLSLPAVAQTRTTPDNSANNRTQNQTATADQAKNDKSDREVTARIRRAVIADKSLSMYAHNVKIIVVAGAVTLKGPVHSEAEKQTVVEKAAQVVGADKVSDQITVKQ